jgi:hypothetical protein
MPEGTHGTARTECAGRRAANRIIDAVAVVNWPILHNLEQMQREWRWWLRAGEERPLIYGNGSETRGDLNRRSEK